MTAKEAILLNFKETRRRSINLWKGIPIDFLHWKPDHEAMSCIEMVRHVLESEHIYHVIIQNRGELGDFKSPWDNLPYTTVEQELEFAQFFSDKFMQEIKDYSEDDLSTIEIIRPTKNQRKILGDYLNRIVFHEAVHMGQLLSYLRTLGIERPLIWD
ncbi:DinB superfamily protein [compost metagenome]